MGKNTLGDSEKGVADKIGDDDKETIEKALEEVNEWLDDNQDAEKEDFDEKLKEVQDTCSPIISKVYQESGVPQIEVSFEIDANGILNVGAEDKGTGKTEKITITNDKGRLSQEDIERMVQEAEEFQEEDKKVRDKIESRNALENYVYSMKNTLGDSEKGVADKIDDDRETIEKALEEVNEWLDDNQDAEKEDFDEKLKEVQDTCSPIISKVYQESGGAPGGGGDFGGDDDLDGHDEL